MAGAGACPRCGAALDQEGRCPSCRTPTPGGRAGDDTLGKIKQLAGGWDLAHSVAPPIDADDVGAVIDEKTPTPIPRVKAPRPSATPARERERLSERQRDREPERQRHREPEREPERQRHREPEREPERATQRRMRTPTTAVLDELEAESSVAELEAALLEDSGDQETRRVHRDTLTPVVSGLPDGLLDELADPTSEVDLDAQQVITPHPDDTAQSAPPAAPPPPPLPPPPPKPPGPPESTRAGEITSSSSFDGPSVPLGGTKEPTDRVVRPPLGSSTSLGVGGGTSVSSRRRGLGGDVRYALIAPFRAFTGARELARLRERLDFERTARSRRLAELARAVAADTRLESAAFVAAREALAAVEEERSHHASFANAAEDEAKAAEKARAATVAELEKEAARLTGEISKLEKSELEPLEADVLARRKEFDAHKEVLSASAKRIANIEKRLAKTITTEPERKAEVEADLAAARAERQALLRDEPKLAGRVTELEPKVDEVKKRRDGLRDELKKAKDRATAESERLTFSAKAARDRQASAERAQRQVELNREAELVKLGEAIGIERPMALLGKLRPVDEHTTAISVLDRQIEEVEEARRGLDRGALIRGGLILFAVFGAVIAIAVAALLRSR